MTDEINYPLKPWIVAYCKELITSNFMEKGNSWANGQQTPMPYMLNLLQRDYAKFIIAFASGRTNVAKAGGDLINVIAMLMCRYDKEGHET